METLFKEQREKDAPSFHTAQAGTTSPAIWRRTKELCTTERGSGTTIPKKVKNEGQLVTFQENRRRFKSCDKEE